MKILKLIQIFRRLLRFSERIEIINYQGSMMIPSSYLFLRIKSENDIPFISVNSAEKFVREAIPHSFASVALLYFL